MNTCPRGFSGRWASAPLHSVHPEHACSLQRGELASLALVSSTRHPRPGMCILCRESPEHAWTMLQQARWPKKNTRRETLGCEPRSAGRCVQGHRPAGGVTPHQVPGHQGCSRAKGRPAHTDPSPSSNSLADLGTSRDTSPLDPEPELAPQAQGFASVGARVKGTWGVTGRWTYTVWGAGLIISARIVDTL